MKKAMVKLAFASTLSTMALLATFTARPAQALTCPGSFQGCGFIGMQPAGEGVACCTYECADGSRRILGCIHT